MIHSPPAPVVEDPPASAKKDAEHATHHAIRLGRGFIDAVVAGDFDRLEILLAPDVRFRALTPRTARETDSAAGARSIVRDWFGETDHRELTASGVDIVGDRVHVGYRLLVHELGSWSIVEQHLVATIGGDCLTDVALLCSGFRPVATAPEAARHDRRPPGDGDAARALAPPEPGEQSVPEADARLDAIGTSCATLTPSIRSAVTGLEPGQVLEIVADDPSAPEGLQSWSRLTGNELVAAVHSPGGPSRYYVRRGAIRSVAERHPKGAQ